MPEKVDAAGNWLIAASGNIEAGPDQLERLDELLERIGERRFFAKINSPALCKCIDGRPSQESIVGANSAGGSLSYVVAEDLTGRRFSSPSFLQTVDATLAELKQLGLPVGGHTGHADAESSGCGANDHLADIYSCIAEKASDVRDLSEKILGKPIDDAVHDLIVANAATRDDFGNGADNAHSLAAHGVVEQLEGPHREVAAVINFQPGTTLDRIELANEFGDSYQVFNIDAWALPPAAETLAQSEAEIDAEVTALTYYNVATALVLCGPRMPAVILK